MPIEGLVDHPEAMTLPAAAFGMLARLTIHFWVTECRSLPMADHELRSISRGHAPTWRHWKAIILGIFESIRPKMEAAWQARENRVGNLIRLSQRSSSMRRGNALRSNANAAMTGGNASAYDFPLISRKRRQPAQEQPASVEKPNGGFRD